MTLPRFPRSREPAPGRAAAETFGRIPDWDGTTIAFGGASGIGLPGRAAPAPLPPPAPRPYDAAIFTILPGGGFGLLCGIDLWRRHADPEAAWYRSQFDALRVSALRAGWRPDAYGRWCCPRCLMDPAYAAARPVAHWHPGAAHARTGPGSSVSREYWQQEPATEYHGDAAAALIAGDPAAEFWFQVEAEVGVLCRTAEGALHGRHEAGTR